MSEYHLIQDNGNGGIEIADGDSLEEVISKVAEMEGLKV